MKILQIIFLALAMSIKLSSADVLWSNEELSKLQSNQKELIDQLSNFIGGMEEEIVNLKSKLNLITSEHKLLSKNPETYIQYHPNTLALIKTFTHDISTIKTDLHAKFDPLDRTIEALQLPSAYFDAAISTFLQIQEIYRLKSKDLAQGVFAGEKIRRWMTAEELFTLGSKLLTLNRVKASNFLRFALKRADEATKTDFLGKILDFFRTNEEFKAEIATIEEENETKLNKTVEFLAKMKPAVKIGRDAFEKMRDDYQETENKFFSQACRGVRVRAPSIIAQLSCKFHSTSDFTKIAPFKVEIMNLDPLMALVHDAVNEEEMEVLKSVKSDKMQPIGLEYQNECPASLCAVKNVKDNDHKLIERVSKRIEDFTGLYVRPAEEFFVQKSGSGGGYRLHFDHYNSWDNVTYEDEGNRMTSVLFYLSDLKGGSTVFPFLKITAEPKKGAAIYWHNLSSSGHKESLTYHGSCPNLIGNRWIAQKMLSEYGQEFKRPCELEPKETVEQYWTYFHNEK